jgi:glycosyltransferase involved in cell wall biosynthesis
LRILLLSPYHGGSHWAWAEGLRDHSAHAIDILGLPANFWKWRMHGGAITLARRWLEGNLPPPDLLLATDMLDLTTFLALTRRRLGDTPAVLYMHENQLTYPLPEDPTIGPMRRQLGERDYHYAFINVASMLAADRVYFNSDFHRTSFFAALPPYLSHNPDQREREVQPALEARSGVLPVGVDFARLDGPEAPDPGRPPLLVWNQRWEYDKDPEAFLRALLTLAEEGLDFEIALCGERFGADAPAGLRDKLATRIIHDGYAEAATYRRLLRSATATVSTAHHEFFGISILEAIYAGAFPILPNRLSYPELLPTSFHDRCLYDSQGGLLHRLRWALLHPREARAAAAGLGAHVAAYDWRALAPRYDSAFGAIASH